MEQAEILFTISILCQYNCDRYRHPDLLGMVHFHSQSEFSLRIVNEVKQRKNIPIAKNTQPCAIKKNAHTLNAKGNIYIAE